jgi:ComF family protein
LKFIESPYCKLCGRVFPTSYSTIINDLICEDCKTSKLYFSIIRSVSIFLYEGVIKTCISLFKYQKKLFLAELLASFLIDYLLKNNKEFVIDYILAVPIHKKRYKERGFNQSEVLAKIVSKKFNIPYLANCLYKIKNTRPQVELSGEARKKNVKGTFVINPHILPKISGMNILLIDDVYTTGATVRECSFILKTQSEVDKINILTLARSI